VKKGPIYDNESVVYFLLLEDPVIRKGRRKDVLKRACQDKPVFFKKVDRVSHQ